MKSNQLFKTNLLISIILLVGFLLTGILSYRANYQTSLDNIEQVSALSSEGIYYQISSLFAAPINTSLTMAHDSLLVEHIAKEADHLEDEAYLQATKDYLNAYQKKYGFDSVFLVTADTARYYNFNGFDRTLEEGDPENVWYYSLLQSDLEYSLAVDNDQVYGANDEITVFINCKIFAPDSTDVLGVVGVGIRIEYLKELLQSYEEKFHLKACLIAENGDIEISTTHTGYQRVNWFELYAQEEIKPLILENKNSQASLESWTTDSAGLRSSYVVSRYIPEMSWYLLVIQDTDMLLSTMRMQMYQTFLILAAMILTILIVITGVIRNFNNQITRLLKERQDIFKEATEHLYDNIYEVNITKDRAVGKQTEQYFELLGAKGLPYSEGLQVVAKNQIKEEYREGYLSTFSPSNVNAQYEAGNNHLQYDFMISDNGADYYWMQIDAYIFYSKEDASLHMFIYRKNIDENKRREEQAQTDEMTGFYTKKAAERMVGQLLLDSPGCSYAFFLLDIDNFKQANDSYGHTFGDYCIKNFTEIIRNNFDDSSLFGRMGGDEFAVFLPIAQDAWVREKADALFKALNVPCVKDGASWTMSASIGVAVILEGGTDFATLFQKADEALYQTKRQGKNGFTIVYLSADPDKIKPV